MTAAGGGSGPAPDSAKVGMANEPRRSPSLAGARVWVTGERKGEAMARILGGHGAEAIVVPTLETRIVTEPEPRRREARAAAAGRYGAAVFLTGFGARLLFQAAEEANVAETLRSRLVGTFVVARSPKARSGLRAVDVGVDAEPHEATVAAVVGVLRRHRVRVSGQTVLVQRHGRPEPVLEDGVRELGGALCTVDLYRYAPPADLPAVRRMLDRCGAGALDAVVFTSPPAARGLVSAAEQTGRAESFRRAACERLIIAAVGSSTGATLESAGVPVHVVPDDYTQPALARALGDYWQAERRPSSTKEAGGAR